MGEGQCAAVEGDACAVREPVRVVGVRRVGDDESAACDGIDRSGDFSVGSAENQGAVADRGYAAEGVGAGERPGACALFLEERQVGGGTVRDHARNLAVAVAPEAQAAAGVGRRVNVAGQGQLAGGRDDRCVAVTGREVDHAEDRVGARVVDERPRALIAGAEGDVCRDGQIAGRAVEVDTGIGIVGVVGRLRVFRADAQCAVVSDAQNAVLDDDGAFEGIVAGQRPRAGAGFPDVIGVGRAVVGDDAGQFTGAEETAALKLQAFVAGARAEHIAGDLPKVTAQMFQITGRGRGGQIDPAVCGVAVADIGQPCGGGAVAELDRAVGDRCRGTECAGFAQHAHRIGAQPAGTDPDSAAEIILGVHQVQRAAADFVEGIGAAAVADRAGNIAAAAGAAEKAVVAVGDRRGQLDGTFPESVVIETELPVGFSGVAALQGDRGTMRVHGRADIKCGVGAHNDRGGGIVAAVHLYAAGACSRVDAEVPDAGEARIIAIQRGQVSGVAGNQRDIVGAGTAQRGGES